MYWPALMASISMSIRSLLAVIRAGGNDSYPFSAGGYRFRNPKSSVESPARRGPRMPLRGAGSSVPPECNVPRPGRKLLRQRGVGHAASIRFECNRGGCRLGGKCDVSDWQCEGEKMRRGVTELRGGRAPWPEQPARIHSALRRTTPMLRVPPGSYGPKGYTAKKEQEKPR